MPLLTAIAALIAFALPSVTSHASSIPKLLRGDGTITFYRPDKDERATIRYRDASGHYSPKAFDRIAHLFRCRLTDQEHQIDADLIELLDAVEDHFDAHEIRLISTYRSPERNASMRRHGRHVAKDSLHMYGMAADIEIAGVSKKVVRDFAYALHGGGVGYYARSSFVHLDSGEPRIWGFKPVLSRSRPATAQK